MNESATNDPVSQQHPLLADRARLDRITSNMHLTIQKVMYGSLLGNGEERLLCGGVSARDVLQEAVSELLRFDRASLSASWEALGATIARCRAIDAVRSSVRGRRAVNAPADAPDEITVVAFDPALHEPNLPTADFDDPERAFVLNEQQKVLLKLVRELPEPQRTIFNAVHFEGRTRVEVSKAVNLTQQRVGQIYSETLKKLWERARSDPAFPSEVDREEHA